MTNVSNNFDKTISFDTPKSNSHIYDKISKKILTLSNGAAILRLFPRAHSITKFPCIISWAYTRRIKPAQNNHFNPIYASKIEIRIQKKRTLENMEALRLLILDDIMNLIQGNQVTGNIAIADANRLRSLIRKLYNHLHSHCNEFTKENLTI